MRAFANLFLLLFLADGGFSLVDELVPLLTPLAPFTGLRTLLAGAVIVMCVPLYLCLGIDRRLPKKVFLPLITFVFFSLVSTWLFPSLAGFRAYGLLLSAGQVVLGMLPLRYFRTDGARSLTMPPEMFTAPFFSIRNSLLFTAASLPVVPLALAMLVLSAADSIMADYTSGFMHLAPGGLRMTERVYTQGDRTVRLAAMIHVGDREYYDGVTGTPLPGRTIILAEGVSDSGKLLQNGIDYGRMAGYLGLTSQHGMKFRGREVGEEELDSTRLRPGGEGDGRRTGEVHILRADLDASDFRPPTILLLNAVGKHLQDSPSFVKGAMAVNSWGEKNITPEMSAVIMDDILHRRNMEVVRLLDRSLRRYDTVVIPWGALHMKELETEVLKRGFVLQEERGRTSIDFRRMITGLL